MKFASAIICAAIAATANSTKVASKIQTKTDQFMSQTAFMANPSFVLGNNAGDKTFGNTFG